MLGCTVPFAMSNYGCASACSFIVKQHTAIKAFLNPTVVQPIKRGFCHMGAQLEVEMWEDILYHSLLPGGQHNCTHSLTRAHNLVACSP